MLSKLMIATLLIGGTTVAMADKDYDRRVDEGRREGAWRTLATRNVDGAERRFIQVGKPAGAFRVLRLQATRGVPLVSRVEIEFGNGQRQVVDINQKLDRSNQVATIDLNGNDRYIENVIVTTMRGSYGELMVSAE